jgi:hypothetical protein
MLAGGRGDGGGHGLAGWAGQVVKAPGVQEDVRGAADVAGLQRCDVVRTKETSAWPAAARARAIRSARGWLSMPVPAGVG